MNLAHCFVVQLDKPVSAVNDDEIIKIHQIIQNQKPAHTSYFLAFSDEAEAGTMGAFMAIGMAPAEAAAEGGAAPPGIGIGIGIGTDGTVYQGEGGTGLIIGPDAGKEGAGGGADEPAKKKPMLQVKSDKGEGEGGGGKT
jgi:hypothetical protein